jgi:hypothetical protein
MTLCRQSLEKRINAIREENKIFARRVAKRLLNERTFGVQRPAKGLEGWRVIKKFSTREEAEKYARRMRVRYWLVEEITE